MKLDRDATISDRLVAVRLATFYALGVQVRRGVDFGTAFAVHNEGWDESERDLLAAALAPKGGFAVGPSRAGRAGGAVSTGRGPKEVRVSLPRRNAS